MNKIIVNPKSAGVGWSKADFFFSNVTSLPLVASASWTKLSPMTVSHVFTLDLLKEQRPSGGRDVKSS